MNKRDTRQAINDLEAAREAATMTRAAFSPDNGFSTDAYTAQVREATRLYRETWIIGPIDMALKVLRASLAKPS